MTWKDIFANFFFFFGGGVMISPILSALSSLMVYYNGSH